MAEPRGILRPARRVIATATALVLVLVACTKPEQVAPTTVPGSAPSTVTFDGVELPTPPPPARIAPVLRKPGPPGDALAGVPTLLGGLVLAEHPIVRIELWNGNELVEATDFEDPKAEARPAWQWVPPEPGLFGLVLRAIDDQGGVATSFPLWVRVRELVTPDGVGLSAPTAPASGALLGLAARALPNPGPPEIAVDAESCLATLTIPGVADAGTDGAIAVYAASFGGAGFVPAGLVPSSGGEVTLLMGAAPLMVYTEAFDTSSAIPGPPMVAYPPNPCLGKGLTGDIVFENGVMGNPKGADRAYLYVSSDGGETWDRAPETDQTFVYPDPDGRFDFNGLLPTGGSSFHFEAWGWVGGTLTPLGRGSWTAPEPPAGTSVGQGEAVAAAPFTGSLVPLGDLDWVLGKDTGPGGGPVLVRSGLICTYKPLPAVQATTTTIGVTIVGGGSTVPPTTSPAGPTLGVLPESCTNYPFGAYSETFRWKPNPGTYSHGLLQVSTLPPPADPVFSFPGLVHTQTVPAPQGGGHTDVVVPLKDLITPPAQTVSIGDQEALGAYDAMTFQMIAGLGAAAAEPAGGQGQWIQLAIPQLVQAEVNKTFYVRVLPMKDTTTPLFGISNDVVIEIEDTAPLPEPPAPAQPPAMALAVQMTPPHLPNSAYQRCVRVIENPWSPKNPDPATTWLWNATHPGVPLQFVLPNSYKWAENSAFIYENGVKVQKGLVPGATVCAVQLDPPDKDLWDYIVDAVNFIGWVWDMYVYVWDMMKGWAADVLAYASGCVSIAKATGMSTQDAEKKCSGFASTAITAVMVAYGIPPTMPKFKDLVELGKGELKEVILKVVKDQGLLDCSVLQSECDKLAGDLLDELLDQVQIAATQAATQAATSGSQWVLSIHPGIYVIPEPAGTLSPAVFKITVTRSTNPSAPAPPASCTYTARVFGDKESYSWQNYAKGVWVENQPISTSAVMASKSVTMTLGDLKPGESRSASLVLDTLVPWYPEGQNPQLPKVPWSVKPQTHIFLSTASVGGFSPTTLTTSLSGGPNCGTVSQVFPQDTKSTEPWEIPS